VRELARKDLLILGFCPLWKRGFPQGLCPNGERKLKYRKWGKGVTSLQMNQFGHKILVLLVEEQF
jgi:hypothetical protein